MKKPVKTRARRSPEALEISEMSSANLMEEIDSLGVYIHQDRNVLLLAEALRRTRIELAALTERLNRTDRNAKDAFSAAFTQGYGR